ncbi:DUF6789 family protein [Polyangium aurulentum]|uniref:DUF6789 family protein n=1 Tax=Polyangium aurulentum TaxID=2567896 RepID=UPI0010AE4013|nr:DUF6789 family protein [Polyangium aurulentum]UQA58032.1 DUF1440 domain-containing protein [Polyangium aurulentum]
MVARGRQQTTIAITGGALSGILGGIALSLYMLLATIARGADPWLAFKFASVAFYGDRALQHGFSADTVIWGILAHFAIAAGWGLLFGLLVFGASRGATVFAGVVWGFVVWIAMYHIVLPLAGLADIAQGSSAAGSIIAHIIFGVSLAIGFLPFQRPMGYSSTPLTTRSF